MTSVVCIWHDKDPALLVPMLPCVIDDWDVIPACPWCKSFGVEDETDFDPLAPCTCANCHRLFKVEPLGYDKIRIVGVRSETDLRFMALNFFTEDIVNAVHLGLADGHR
ncbi:MAG: hypothetical protein RH946_00670 [Rhodospirillales bacterium]